MAAVFEIIKVSPDEPENPRYIYMYTHIHIYIHTYIHIYIYISDRAAEGRLERLERSRHSSPVTSGGAS